MAAIDPPTVVALERLAVDPATVPGSLTGLSTPTELIAAVAARRELSNRCEAEIMALAVDWAHAHPCLPDADGIAAKPVTWRAARSGQDADGHLTDGGPDATVLDVEEFCDFGLPPVAWDAPAAFAAANGMSTPVGRALIRDALTLRHRLPLTWEQVQLGRCPAWRAAKVAQAVIGRAADVASYVDEIAAAKAGGIGPVVLQRVLDAAMLELYPEDHEGERVDALQAQDVRLVRNPDYQGLAELVVRGDWTDLVDFDRAVSQIAAALAVVVDADPDLHPDLIGTTADVRRARAVGVLAHPEDALALLAAAQQIVDTPADPDQEVPAARRRGVRARKQVVLHVRLTDAALLGMDVACTDHARRALLADLVREWCGRADAAVTVAPLLAATPDRYEESVPSHDPPAWMRELVLDRDQCCVFPFCSVPARDCDLDHITAWDPQNRSSSTRAANLAPLCRFHHRLKTPAGQLVWHYRSLAPGVYLWTDPHRRHYLRTRDGTLTLRPPPDLASG